MRLNTRKIIGLFLLLFCAQVLTDIGLGEVFGTANDLTWFMPFLHWNLNPKKDH